MRLIVAAVFCLSAAATQAAQVEEALIDAQTREISKGLRCLVCQGENVWESNSTLAQQMRGVVRERLEAGENPEQIRAYLQGRYGDFVLMEPPKRGLHWVLWLTPLALLLVGALLLRRTLLRWRDQSAAGPASGSGRLTEAERRRIETELARLGDD
jgi:cytochrome c-type biogenesis protein CcmH